MEDQSLERISINRMMLYVKSNIRRVLKNQIGRYNNPSVRYMTHERVYELLRDLRSKRGVQDFTVQCDSGNNTPEVIEANQLVVDICITPVNSVETISFTSVLLPDNDHSLDDVMDEESLSRINFDRAMKGV